MRREARLSADDFLARYGPAIRSRRIRIGASFAIEQFAGDADSMRALRMAVEDHGVIDLRLGLRWDRLRPASSDERGDVYDPLLDYCFSQPLITRLCLDIGPIKTFRWPEEHVPEHVLRSLRRIPPRRAVITPADELAEVALDHFERTLEDLGKRHRGQQALTFCFNEVFHPFGQFAWTMSEGFIARLIRTVEASPQFAGAGFVINSAGPLDLDRIGTFFARMLRAHPALAGRLTCGYDLYPFLPPLIDVPVAREALDLVRRAARPWRAAARRNIRRAQAVPYRIEVTEAQTEPWGVERRPGNSLAHYQYVLAESIDHVLNPRQEDSVIRMWGIEHLLRHVLKGTATPEHKAILDLTRRINEITDPPRS